jgi:hypothetical protein
MRKIFPFEISVATKDRPKSFQFITLALFLSSITVILIGMFLRIAEPAAQKQVVANPQPHSFAGITTVQAAYSVQK